MPMFPDGDERCVAILFGGEYINRKCDEAHAYICEMPAYGVNSAKPSSKAYVCKYLLIQCHSHFCLMF